MPSNHYTENEERWKSLSDIDWFSQFIKAWITFNAWYRNNYPSLNQDRQIIDEIKRSGNTVRDRIENCLRLTDANSQKFKQHIANLHTLLEDKIIRDRSERLQFTEFFIENNFKTKEEFTRRAILYIAEKITEREFRCTVTKTSGVSICSITHTTYSKSLLENESAYQSLTTEQKKSIMYCYDEINPKKKSNLLAKATDAEIIEIGTYRFVNDRVLISKAIIEMIYKLRCVLFHGEIVPDKETAKIYEPAYHILKMLVG